MPVGIRDIPDLLRWIEEGLTLKEMGARLGSKRQTIHAFLKKNNIPYEKRRRIGARNGRWKGGRIVDEDGYILIKSHGHPHADRHNYVREHRLVVEEKLGRYLDPREVVHHIDGNRQNNYPDNLEVFGTNGEHLAATLVGQIPKWTPEGLERMREGSRKPRARRRKPTPDPSTPDDEQ